MGQLEHELSQSSQEGRVVLEGPFQLHSSGCLLTSPPNFSPILVKMCAASELEPPPTPEMAYAAPIYQLGDFLVLFRPFDTKLGLNAFCFRVASLLNNCRPRECSFSRHSACVL